MHNDKSILMNWRIKHKIHHRESEGKIDNNNTALIFTNKESLYIIIVTFIPIIILYLLGYYKKIIHKLYPIIYIFILYFMLIYFGIGVHNYCHTKFHRCKKKHNNCLKISVPKFLFNIICNHHKNHHINCKTNFCVVFLGFDNIIGTKY